MNNEYKPVTRKRPLLGKRTWQPEEEAYLMEVWGTRSIEAIANHLHRTVSAIKTRAQRLSLGPVLMAGDYIAFSQLIHAVTGTTTGGYGYKMESWVKKRGLPVHMKKVENQSFRVVYIDEFWEWAEKNRAFIDFSKFEPLILGKEPDWVAEQRRKDFTAHALQRKDPWTQYEDNYLTMLLRQQKYGYQELAQMLNRSEGAIQRRCLDLGLKERPVKADNHSAESKWTDASYRTLAEGIRHGDSYAKIAASLCKSEKAVRGKVYNTYFTENAGKVRAYMGAGEWGHGAPEPLVRQALYLPKNAQR